jgi:hypothetical protein
MGSAPSPETNYPVVFRIFPPLLRTSSRILPYVRPDRLHSAPSSIHDSPMTPTLDVSNHKCILSRKAFLNGDIILETPRVGTLWM